VIRRVKLYCRTNDGDGVFSRRPVVFGKNGRAVTPKGNVTTYLIRKAGRFIAVGDDLDAALIRFQQETLAVGTGGATSGGLTALPRVPTSGDASGRIRIADAAADYRDELKTLGKAKYTAAMYLNAVDAFVAGCSKTFIDEINRKDILGYIEWMRLNLKVRVPGGQSRTIRNHLTYLGIFLAKRGVKLVKPKGAAEATGLLFYDDLPRTLKKKPKKYDQETIDKLIEKADLNEKDYLMFLLWSGFRDEEVQYLEWKDFDFKNGTVTCHAKPHFNWKPKDSEERTVGLPSAVVALMKDRRKRDDQHDLVFPNGDGNPDSHLIYRLHSVAKKAGLDLKGQRAGHMFRKTAGSRVAKRLGLRAAMDFLGHSDVQTTALYLAADDMTSKKSREVFDEMYENGD
jgi:integrase